MSDLLDIARPIRDAAVAETLTALAPDATQASRDGGILAAHLVAVVMAWGSERHELTTGMLRDPELMDALGYALGLLLANAGMNYRPTYRGQMLPPTLCVRQMIQRAIPTALKLAALVENGCAEVSMPIIRQTDGSLGPAEFDVMAMLGGKR